MVSIVSITWNNLEGLRATVESVLAQDGADDFEVIVVDNMSSDGTDEFIASLQDPRIRYMRQPDSGVYDAMNKGTRAAGFNKVIYLNAGDILHDRGSLACMVGLAETHPSAPMVVVGAHQVGPDGSTSVHRNVPHRWFPHAFGLRPHCHAAMVFDVAAVRAAGGYSLESDFAGDFDLILRLGLLGEVPSDPRICIDYDTTGMSAQRKAEIPELLHRIRTTRFQYPRWARRLDLTFVRTLEAYRGLRRRTHRR